MVVDYQCGQYKRRGPDGQSRGKGVVFGGQMRHAKMLIL